MRATLPRLAFAAMIALLLGACDMAEETVEFKPVRFSDIESWADDDHEAAFRALLKSCRRMKQPDAACEAALALGDDATRDAARTFFETHYVPHEVVGGAPGFVTGYYEPEVKGARERGQDYDVPVYARPDDLLTLKADDERARFNETITGVRKTPGGEVPYFTRAEIDGGALSGRGLELLYLDDPVELFFMQVQGSGRVRLADGQVLRLGFAAKNGHPYTSIGKRLVEMDEGKPADLTMQGVKAWLRADPERARKLMHENRSYVFFREIDGDGPIGAQGVALTPERSLAVDTEYHALGLPVFVAAPDLAAPDGTTFRRLMVAQDVGSAIRGPERGDIFWGSGEAAGEIAGRTRHSAKFTVLLPK
jgi:membrane-bound lytic murein transglycosylase A